MIGSLIGLSRSELSFPRLGQMVVDYDPPMKKISEEFIPHSKVSNQLINRGNLYFFFDKVLLFSLNSVSFDFSV